VVNSLLERLQHVDVGNAANVSERNAASSFRVKVLRVGEFQCICRFMQMEEQILAKLCSMFYENTFTNS
jgi:hypothetical protein